VPRRRNTALKDARMPEVAIFEKCPACGWSIFIILAGKVRRCCKCRHEWKKAE
jgi:hypothetical protein